MFLERERNLKLEVEKLGRSPEEIQREIDRTRQDSLQRSNQPPPATEGAPRLEISWGLGSESDHVWKWSRRRPLAKGSSPLLISRSSKNREAEKA